MIIARAATIQYENRVLLDKMMDIEKKKTNLNPDTIAKKSNNPGKTLNTNKRVRELRKINDENKVEKIHSIQILNRLGSPQKTSISSFSIQYR